ncbi:hypothetical protein HZC30_01330 [Candidatus Woesearchaeota archaeon]|nr:hypothetical protein [Candidatus Woesearchaeota archaeon]
MEEKTIYKVSLVLIVVGLIILGFYVDQLEFKAVANLDEVGNTELVKLSGEVTKVTTRDKVIFLEVEGCKTEKNTVIIFDSEQQFLQEGDSVEITGAVEEYNGKKELIASKVVKK